MGLNVLSLFDGISCGQVALQRAGLKVDNYFASEIEKHAISITQANHPNTVQLGDVSQLKTDDLPKIDILIGGSPCQGFSYAGKQLNFDDPRSKLFFEYVRILGELRQKNPDIYFLLENVNMKKESRDIITQFLGVEPIEINSSLVSAQLRKRLYWTNIPGVQKPNDKKITFKDIEDHNEASYEYWSDERVNKINNKEYVRKDVYRFTEDDGKVNCITVRSAYSSADDPKKRLPDGRIRRLTIIELERAQTLPDNYTNHIKGRVARRAAIGNGWTVDVISHIFSYLPKTE